MFDYFSKMITARRAEPKDDLVSALTAAEVDGARRPTGTSRLLLRHGGRRQRHHPAT